MPPVHGKKVRPGKRGQETGWHSAESCAARHLEKLCCPMGCTNGTVLLRVKLTAISFCSTSMQRRRDQQAHHSRAGACCCMPAARSRLCPPTAGKEPQEEQGCSQEDTNQEPRWPQHRQPPAATRCNLTERKQDRQSGVLAHHSPR